MWEAVIGHVFDREREREKTFDHGALCFHREMYVCHVDVVICVRVRVRLKRVVAQSHCFGGHLESSDDHASFGTLMA